MHAVASVPIKLARRSRKNKQRSLTGNSVKLRTATWNENIVKQKISMPAIMKSKNDFKKLMRNRPFSR